MDKQEALVRAKSMFGSSAHCKTVIVNGERIFKVGFLKDGVMSVKGVGGSWQEALKDSQNKNNKVLKKQSNQDSDIMDYSELEDIIYDDNDTNTPLISTSNQQDYYSSPQNQQGHYQPHNQWNSPIRPQYQVVIIKFSPETWWLLFLAILLAVFIALAIKNIWGGIGVYGVY